MASLLLYNQVRTRFTNFFNRPNVEQMMKSATGMSKRNLLSVGRKKQRPIRGVQRFYYLGASPLKVQYPGLNLPLGIDRKGGSGKNVTMKFVPQRHETLMKHNLLIMNYFKDKKPPSVPELSRSLNFNRQHPLDRGYVSWRPEGVMLGPPPFYGRAFKDFQCVLLGTSRLSFMKPGIGRAFKMKALVFVGNGNGIGGYAIGTSGLGKPHAAMMDGFKRALKNLFFIERLDDHTVYHDFFAECSFTKIFVRREYQGHGITAHPRIETICRLLGIKDIYVKVTGGATNYTAICHAFVFGLLHQETHRALAERAGMHVVKLDPAKNYYPEVICSPIEAPMKKEEDLTLQERLRLDEFYGEGRYPLQKYDKWAQIRYRKKKFKDMYTTPVEYKKWPYRNMQQVVIRLLADGELPRYTRKARALHGHVRHEEAMKGLRIIPRGIGLDTPRIPVRKQANEE